MKTQLKSKKKNMYNIHLYYDINKYINEKDNRENIIVFFHFFLFNISSLFMLRNTYNINHF